MPFFNLDIQASASFLSNAPTLQILRDGEVVSSETVNQITGSGFNTFSYTFSYSGSYPGTLSFRFLDGSAESGRSVTIESVAINGAAVNDDYISQTLLNLNDNSVVNTAAVFAPPSPSGITSPWGEDMPDLADLDPVTLTGTAGDDKMSGEAGLAQDVFDAGAGNDQVNGQRGDDQIWGGDGNDNLIGDEGDDIVIGADGDDNLRGDEGEDIIYGGLGNDKLYGGDDDDYLSGNEGADKIYGNDGDDIIFGGDGNDKLYGQAGSDTIHGGDGADKIYSGDGANTLYGDGGNDKIFSTGEGTTAYGGIGNDKIRGHDGTDIFYGEDGDDVLSGYDGNDTLNGGSGNDRLYGHGGNDTIDGGTGDDLILAHDGTDVVTAGAGNDTIKSEAGNDDIDAGADNDFVNSGAGNDTIDGGTGTDYLIGGSGADTIDGGGDNDVIHGHGLSAVDINQILKANVNVVYSAESNSFYQLVNSGGNPTWDAARSGADALTLNGVNGHLATITSAAEHDFIIDNVYDGDNAWLGGSDTKSEGHWRWDVGIDAGIDFWVGGIAGATVNGSYANWEATQPNDSVGNQDYAYILNTTNQWADALINGGSGFVDIPDYIVEWDAGLFLDDNAADTLNGDAGNDTIYGYGGNDIIDGGTGNDLLRAGDGDDTVNGGADTDVIYGGDGGDILRGDDGDDVIFAGSQIRVDIPNIDTVQAYGAGQDGGGTTTLLDDGLGVEFDDNAWKKIEVNYEVTANTVIEFDFKSTSEAEISGIGFDTDDTISSNLTFKVYGTQNWGRTDFDNYDGSGDWVHYEINVGSFFTGTFEWLTLLNDDDGGPANNDAFQNIVIHEGGDGDNTLYGGDGFDKLYGDAGIDTFVFEAASAFNDVDEIYYFDRSEDILDISDILTNWTDGHPQRGDIDNYLQFTEVGDNLQIGIDANGNSGGSSFTVFAEILGGVDLDASDLYDSGQIITI